MISNRPYRQAMDWEYCKKEILENKALQFDPVVVEAAIMLFPKWYKKYYKEKNIVTEVG